MSSYFSTRHDAELATLTKNDAAQSFRNDLNGLERARPHPQLPHSATDE